MANAISMQDLENAKTDVDHIAAVATSLDPTATDRLGHVKQTLAGAVGSIAAVNDRGAWATGAAYLVKDLVTVAGLVYICVVGHTAGATFAGDSAKWRVYQGLTVGEFDDFVTDLADQVDPSNGAGLIGVSALPGDPTYAAVPSGTLRAVLTGLFGRSEMVFASAPTSVLRYMTPEQIEDVTSFSGSVDVTAAMVAAHATGRVVHYPAGRYKFSTLTISTGGIVGEGKATILDSTDTTAGNVITYTGVDSTALLVNEQGAIFKDFYLRVDTATQKSAGYGIWVNPGTTNENYTTLISNVTVRNVPGSVGSTNSSFITIRDCYFAFYSIAGVYEDNNVAAFEDNGDNGYVNNWFYTNRPNAVGVKYRGGGLRAIGNKINGGLIGVDISPLRSSSIALVQGNTIEGQTQNCVRVTSEGDSVATEFSQVMINNNQLNGYAVTGPVISVNPTAYTLKKLKINDNVCTFYRDLANAIDVRGTDHFEVNDNIVDCNGLGYRGYFFHATATNGQANNNIAYGYTNAHTLNNSTSVVESRVVGAYSGTSSPPSIAAGGTYQETVAVSGATPSCFAAAAFSTSVAGIQLTAKVEAADTVVVLMQNTTGAPIAPASGALKVKVFL